MSSFREYFEANLEKIKIDDFKDYGFDLKKDFGVLIKKVRKNKKISQVELSKISGISQSNISKIEAGKYNASLNQIERLLTSLESKVIMEVGELWMNHIF